MSDEFDDDLLDDDLVPGDDPRPAEATSEADQSTPDPDTSDDSDDTEPNPASWLDRLVAAGGGVLIAPLLALAPLLSVVPASWRVFRRIHLWSATWMQRASSADALANVRRSSSHEDVLPAKFVEPDDADKERSGWKVKGLGDKRFDPAVHANATKRLGKANIIHINEDDPEQGSWVEATIDNAFQLDREQYLFRDAEVSADVSVYAPPSAGDGGGAMADGGQQAVVERATVQQPGVLHDSLVPLSSRDGFDGQVVSWSQFAEIKSEKSDQDRLREAKNAGWMAAKMDELGESDAWKWVLLALCVGAVLLFHAEIGAFITGLTNSGGGSNAASGVGQAASDALGQLTLPVGGGD